MKRIFKTLLALLITLIFSGSALAETISVGSATVSPGGTATVSIQVSGLTTNIAAATVKLTYNPAIVTVSEAVKGDLANFAKNIDNNNGTVTISTYGDGVAATPVTLANVVLRGVSTASGGATSPLTITINTLTDYNGNNRNPGAAGIINGAVTIGSGGSNTGTVITIQDAGGSSSISGAENSEIPVSIIAKNVQNLGAATITLTYNPSIVTVLSASPGNLEVLTSNINNVAGTAAISAYSSQTGQSGNVTIANLQLKVIGSTGSSSPLTLVTSAFGDSNGASIPNTINNGQLSVVQYLRGDMNCDGVVNIIDALLIAKYSVGLIPAPYTC